MKKKFIRLLKIKVIFLKCFFSKLGDKIDELRDGYWFLTGMSDDETVELIITADETIKNIVFVEELVASAPKLNGWEIHSFKARNRYR
jgi:hypothetical protein